MNFWKLMGVALIVAMLIAICVVEKKQPGRIKHVLALSFYVGLACAAPLAFVETLAVFDVRPFGVDLSVNWAFTPLDLMSFMAVVFLIVLLGGVQKMLLPNCLDDKAASDAKK